MKNVLIVSNTNAGRKKAIKYRKVLQKFLLQNAENFKFISIEELNETDIQNQIEDYDTIIAMGGDGTINKVLPLVINSERVLGIIPCGTANLLAEKLKISNNINKAVKNLQKDSAQKIDTIKINDNLSVLRFGTGFDSDIICKTPQSLKNKFGYFAYFVSGILFALRLKKKEYIIETQTELKSVVSSCIIIANASNMYRNWFSVGKETKLNDGMLDVFILKTQNPILFFLELIKIAFNIHASSNNAEFFQANKLTLKNKWLNSHIDGDEYKFQGDISFQVLKDSIKIIL